jgi:hypothetical protein
MKCNSAITVLLLTMIGCSGPESAKMNGGVPAAEPLDAYAPTTAQHAEVVGTLQRLFDALESGDEALLRSVTDASVVMHFSETLDGATTFGSATLDGLATRITSSEVPLIERMWNQTVAVNGPLATIWTPYDFYVGETFSHCGVDAANMLHTEEGWKIVALSWTRLQPPVCELHPDGPPAS